MKTAGRRQGQRGFTLIELMVAITLLTIVVSIVTASFISITDSMDLARTGSERLRHRQFLYRILSENFTAAYSDLACLRQEFQFLGEDESGAFGDADKLTFCTSLAMPGARALPGVLRKVTLEVLSNSEIAADEGTGSGLDIDAVAYEENAEALDGQTLVITMTPLSAASSFLDEDSTRNYRDNADGDVPQEQVFTRKIPVRSVDFKYFGGQDKDEWEDEWDSIELARLPWAVKVRVNFARTEDEYQEDIASGINFDEDPDFEMVVPLPIAEGVLEPAGEMNHYTNFSEEGADGEFDLN